MSKNIMPCSCGCFRMREKLIKCDILSQAGRRDSGRLSDETGHNCIACRAYMVPCLSVDL